jgi:hypothetical protein
LIFALQWSFVAFFLVSTLTWGAIAVAHASWGEPPASAEATGATVARVLVLIWSLAVAIGLFVQNSLKGPTGCWFRWKEITHIQTIWLQEEVFAVAQDYNAAVATVADAAWRKAHGYP